MKKQFFGAVVVVAIAFGAMINVNLNKVSNKGDLAMANVEALADGEGDDCFGYKTDYLSVESCSDVYIACYHPDKDIKFTTTWKYTSCGSSVEDGPYCCEFPGYSDIKNSDADITCPHFPAE